MTQPDAPAGWYPDPSGRHESRYFNGQWTEQVSTRGVNSIDPLTAPPPPYVQDAQSAGRRSPKVKLAIAGGVVAVAVGITLAVTLSGGSSGGHGFCPDAISLNKQYAYMHNPSAATIDQAAKNLSQFAAIAGQFDSLAGESPSPQNAADLRYVAHWLRDLANGNFAAFTAEESRGEAAANRADSYITDKCA